MPMAVNLAGRRFGRWTVIELAETVNRTRRWSCRCDCGSVRIVHGQSLVSGRSQSCGCLHRELLRTMMTERIKHGHARDGQMSPEYVTWQRMIQRCTDANSNRFASYGGRGITVCDRWRHSFENFLEDMGPRPGPDYSLDRVGDANVYGPDTCRWSTEVEQQNNRRDNRTIEHDGIVRTVREWERALGIRSGTLWARLNRGWPVERALATPVRGMEV